MPIKRSAFGDDKTGEQEKPPEAEAPKKRGRRKKAELLEAAVVPAMDAIVGVKFTATGTKGTRTWAEAVELFREGKIEFVDPPDAPAPLKYAVEKMDQQKGTAPEPRGDGELDQDSVEGLTLRWIKLQEMFDELGNDADPDGQIAQEAEIVRKKIIEIGGQDPASDEAYAARAGSETDKVEDGSGSVPPDADIGDLVRIGSDVYRVGHGGVLTSGPVADVKTGEIIHPKRTWQRELGTGGKGSWQIIEIFSEQSASNGKPAEPTVTREIVDSEMVEAQPGSWKVGTGVLEKIGLPDFSNLVIGPNTISTFVADDGRRTKTTLPGGDGREVTVPTAVVEAYAQLADTVEYVTRLQRGHLIAFLEAVKPGSTAPRV